MKLYTSTGSPFARKCRIVAREKAVEVEEVALDFPYKGPQYVSLNPVGQVPALELDDGGVLTNSPVIAAWLDAHSDGSRLLPPESAGEAHWRVRRLETLGDQINEMTVKLVLEHRRPETQRSPAWIEAWSAALTRGLDHAEALAGDSGAGLLDLGVITLAIAATYVGFRRPDVDWRAGRPELTRLTETLEARPSFIATYPR